MRRANCWQFFAELLQVAAWTMSLGHPSLLSVLRLSSFTLPVSRSKTCRTPSL